MTTFENERKSISTMTDEELREELRRIRKARRTPTKRKSVKGPAKKSNPLPSNISPELARKLLKEIGCEEN